MGDLYERVSYLMQDGYIDQIRLLHLILVNDIFLRFWRASQNLSATNGRSYIIDCIIV